MNIGITRVIAIGMLAYSSTVSSNPLLENPILVDGIETTPILIPAGNPGNEPMAIVYTRQQQETFQRNKESLSKKGYIEQLDKPPRAEYIQQRMKQRLSAVQASGRMSSLQNTGFTELEDIHNEVLPFSVTQLDERYVKKSSDNFLLLGGHKLKQLYTDTEFGTLIIDEMINAETTLDNANISIAGEPAQLIMTKHQGEKWATAVYAPHGDDKLLIVEADRKLVGKQREKFLLMVEELVRSSVN